MLSKHPRFRFPFRSTISVCGIALALHLTAFTARADDPNALLNDDPVDGRTVTVTNGLVEATVAPQLGGRLLVLQYAGGENLLRYEADYSQTKEAVWTSEGSASLSEHPAAAGTWAVPETAAVRWEHAVDIKGARLVVTRELAVRNGVSSVFFRVSVCNDSDKTVNGVGYSIRPHFRPVDGMRLLDGETLDRDGLTKRGTEHALSRFVLETREWQLQPDFPDAGYRLHGEGYMFRIHHNLSLGAIGPGETKSVDGAWQFSMEEPAGQDVEFDWDTPHAFTPVEPLLIADTPPDDVPATPLAIGAPWGVCGHGGEAYFPLWRAAGICWVRRGFGWGRGEPQAGQYDFEAMDATAAAAERAGIRIFGLLLGNPPWATVDGHPNSPPKDLAQWEKYVETLARRYRGRVDVWEIWNEPDIGQFWNGTVDDYVALLAAAYRGAKRGNPDCYVMSAGLDGPGERYLVEMTKRGAQHHCDLIGFHPYAGTPAAAEDRMRAVWRILNYYNVRKPVWVTEVGWQSGGWKEGPGVVDSEATKAQYLREGYARIGRFAEVVSWYVDREAGDMFGLVRPKDQGLMLNPAFHEYRSMTGAAADATLLLEGPEAVAVEAGRETAASWILRNAGQKSVPIGVRFYEPLAWVSVRTSADVLAPGTDCEVLLTFTPPDYAVAGAIPSVLLVWSPQGPSAIGTLELTVENPGDSYAVTVVSLWAMLADAEGNEIGKWTPTGRLPVPAGGYVKQPFRVVNEGSARATFALEWGGPAAAWLRNPPDALAVNPGENRWQGTLAAVPADTQPGVYPLILRAVSTAHPEVASEAQASIVVTAPEE